MIRTRCVSHFFLKNSLDLLKKVLLKCSNCLLFVFINVIRNFYGFYLKAVYFQKVVTINDGT